MHIVIMAPGGRYSADSLPGLSTDDRVTVVAWQGAPVDDGWITVRQSRRSARLVAALSRSLPGRMLVRATPLDPGARFWRASARTQDVALAMSTADLIVAVERDAGYAAWKWLLRARAGGAATDAVRGYAAAIVRIGRR